MGGESRHAGSPTGAAGAGWRLCKVVAQAGRDSARIIDHAVVDKILRHLARKEVAKERGPPGAADLGAAS